MKTLISTVGMTEDDWREHRKAGIGGSDAAAAVGLSRWKSRRQLAMEKLGLYEPVIHNQDAVYWGKALEPLVANRFAEENPDLVIRPVDAILVHPEIDYMFANLDREIVCPTGNGVLEIKTANTYLADKWHGEDVPVDYVLQVQHYLAVTGYSFAWVACLIGGQDYVQRYIERDDDIIQMLYQKEKEFWDIVQSNQLPDWDGTAASERFLKELSLEKVEADKTIELSSEMGSVAKTYVALDKQYKEYSNILNGIEAQRNACKETLINALDDAEVGVVDGYTISAKLFQRRETVTPAYSYRRFALKESA